MGMQILRNLARGLAASVAMSLPVVAQEPAPCGAEVPCPVGARSYHLLPPDDWDGVTPLPVLLHFHGWGRQGTLIVKHSRIAGATRPRGVLLLAPNGRGKTWDFWRPESPDSDFADAVLEDAATRFPIDRDRVFVSGYSYGSAMAWRYACENGAGVRALLAVSGTLDQSEICETAPAEIRHVHGLKDTVLDFPFGPDGDTTYPVALWRDHFGCGDVARSAQYSTTEKDHFERSVWDGCAREGRVVLDVHPRGHFIPRGWFAYQLDELLNSSADNRS
ncbi:polyhydroxybutyrate depolymerase [Litoreibacter ponti]|uniref:Polyhydroxybutyrate depolymerase n=1 Tax=Litoreibacter ponti TaxID=1510457 RepID=A0A2T6BE97_9RHOB|nr:polyhydroxybutyrate depolymerase [Litoreibacter ponti]PTX54375.1 polyhydroxybutyrate depolymerase [Litoreibacter ponti]